MKIIDIETMWSGENEPQWCDCYYVNSSEKFDPVDFAETVFPDFERPAMITEETIERVTRICAEAEDGYIRLIPIDGGDLT